MKKLLPLFIIVIVVGIFFRGVFLHALLPIPSDALIGLYNPFRDAYAKQFPRGIPFKNFLITDPIRQQYPWRELVISLEKKIQLPLWDPYSFSGYPLLANFQSASFYPLNIFFFFLPFSVAWSTLIILQPILAGIFLFLYLRNLKIYPLASVLGAIAFAFSGFSVAWLEWNVVVATILWLPLILLCIDKIVFLSRENNFQFSIFNFQSIFKTKVLKWEVLWLFSICSSLLAGHPQTFFYVFLIQLFYFLVRIIQFRPKLNFYLLSSIFYILFFLITAIQWIPTLQFILLSARNIDQSYLQPGWFVPWQHLLQFIFPDFFGNPTTLNYWGVWNYGELVGYIGILPLIFALFATFFRHDKKTYFWLMVGLVALIFALPTPLGKLPFLLHIPFLSTSQPTRLLGVIDLSLAILAAFGLDYFLRKKTVGLLGVLGIFGLLFGGVWVFAIKFYSIFGITLQNIAVAKHNMIFPTAVFISIAIIVVLFVFFQRHIPKKSHGIIFCVLIFITIVDLLRFADKFDPFTSTKYLYPQTKTITFLQKNLGNFRFMTTDSQILPPNVSNIYNLQSIEGYDPLYIERYGAFIAALQRNAPDISTPFGFNRIITPHDYTSPLINLLGVKYVLTFNPIFSKQYTKIFQEGKTTVYENKDVLPRAFFISQIIRVNNKQEAISMVFKNKNDLNTIAVVESHIQNVAFVKGLVGIIDYSPNRITLQTDGRGLGFLVLTDIYYPTWHVTIDGKETPMYIADFTFRGVIVPAGEHTVAFEDRLF